MKAKKWMVGVLLVALSLWLFALSTQAATVLRVQGNCNHLSVHGEGQTFDPYVRVTVSLASDLSVTLAEEVINLRNGQFNTNLHFARQPKGTRLVVAVGEWDGSSHAYPAQLMAYNCGLEQPVAPTTEPMPPTPIPTEFLPSTPFPTPAQGD